jgi:hypothetical protein
MTGLLLYGLLALTIVGGLGALYWNIDSKAYTRGFVAAETACKEAAALQREEEMGKANLASVNLEKQNEKTHKHYRTITKYVDKVVEKPVYRNVCFDTDGLSAANAALRGEGDFTSKPNDPVPDSGRTGRRDWKNSPAKTN